VSGPGIRPASHRDLDRLAALFAGLLAHHDDGADPRFERATGGAEEALRELLAERLKRKTSRVWVAEGQASSLDALCIAVVMARPPLFQETRRGEIEQLVVRPEARRRGIARALVTEAFAWMREEGASAVDVQVARGNVEGQAFWRALGFDPSMDVLARPL
jgi:ribosomal protein S18 acetylase RimI-like enzyme